MRHRVPVDKWTEFRNAPARRFQSVFHPIYCGQALYSIYALIAPNIELFTHWPVVNLLQVIIARNRKNCIYRFFKIFDTNCLSLSDSIFSGTQNKWKTSFSKYLTIGGVVAFLSGFKKERIFKNDPKMLIFSNFDLGYGPNKSMYNYWNGLFWNGLKSIRNVRSFNQTQNYSIAQLQFTPHKHVTRVGHYSS